MRHVADVDARGRARVQTVNEMESKTVQSDAFHADIRNVLRRYEQMNIGDKLIEADQLFMDVSEMGSFADVQNQVIAAREHFMRLPGKARSIFNHDVFEYLDAASNPGEYLEKLYDAGLVERPKDDTKAELQPVSPPDSRSEAPA